MAYPLGEQPPAEGPGSDNSLPGGAEPPRRWADFFGYSRLACLGCAGLAAAVVLICLCFGVAAAIMG